VIASLKEWEEESVNIQANPTRLSVKELEYRLTSPGPKRLLALDGAGARMAVTLPVLEEIESALRSNSGDPGQRLCDYFDLIGGTGTGGVVAAALALGMTIREARDLFQKFAGELFRAHGILKRFTSKYSSDGVKKALAHAFGDEPLRSPSFKCGVCIFAYRIDTEALVAFHNFHPLDATSAPLLLNDCLRASIAAPTYFEPVSINISGGGTGVFIDADLAMTGGAAVPLLLTATSPDEPFRWPTGVDEMLLVAVGSRHAPLRETGEQAQNRNLIGWASSLPSLLFLDAARQNELFLRAISRRPLQMVVDEEMEQVEGDLLPSAPALTYVRYDVDFTALASLGLNDLVSQTDRLTVQDSLEPWAEWLRIGKEAARCQVNASHFPAPYVSEPRLDGPHRA
jgi:hypothetical protein